MYLISEEIGIVNRTIAVDFHMITTLVQLFQRKNYISIAVSFTNEVLEDPESP